MQEKAFLLSDRISAGTTQVWRKFDSSSSSWYDRSYAGAF